MRFAVPVFIFFIACTFQFLTSTPAFAERVALVIGNSKYENTEPLANPRNDAEAISEKLRKLKFTVFDGYDLSRNKFEELIRDFVRGAEGADAAVFFYAGHGLEVGSINYLVPVDANIRDETDLEFETININDILRFMEREQRTNLIFLDACRDNPMARNLSLNMGTRSVAVGRGLAPVETGVGTMIAYSTQPGNVALDGAGRHSPFTEALLGHIETPNLDVEIMMRSVRRDVMQITAGQQVPWSSSSLTGSFVFQNQPPQSVAALPKAKEIPDEQMPDPAALPEPNTGPETSVPVAVAVPDPEGAARPVGLSEAELALLTQAELNRLGCNAGVEDGKWGRNSRAALARLAASAPSISAPDPVPTALLLRQMQKLEGRICPLVCRATENLVEGACIRKTCRKGQRLSSRGVCYTPKATSSRARATPKRESSCFNFDGATYCQ